MYVPFGSSNADRFHERGDRYYEKSSVLDSCCFAAFGFSFTDSFELWELDGENWVLKTKSDETQPPVFYKVKPHPIKDSVATMRYVLLSNYEGVKTQKQYKLTLTIDDQLVTAEFVTSSS